jgi:hypothetical protein
MELHHRTASDPDLNMKQLFRSDALARIKVNTTSAGILTSLAPLSTTAFKVIAPLSRTGTT